MNAELLRALKELSAAQVHNREARLTPAEALALTACADEMRSQIERMERELEQAYRDRPRKVVIVGGENPLHMSRATRPDMVYVN